MGGSVQLVEMERPKEHCGVFGIYSYSGTNVTPFIIKGLEGLQHRGEESFGIAVNGNPTYRQAGLVHYGYIENRKAIDAIKGDHGIAHVRYSTSGSSHVTGNFHPVDINSSTDLRLAHNGTISNTKSLRKILEEKGVSVGEDSNDTKLSAYLLVKLFEEKNDWASAFEEFDKVKNGSYCFTLLTNNGEVLAARDGRGYKPLCYGYHKLTDTYIIASESFALQQIGAQKVKDIEPGELMILDKNGPHFYRFADKKPTALDSFEIAYFAHPASNIDGIQVAKARQNIGRELFKKFNLKGDIVVPIPESAYYAAEGYSQESGVHLVHALVKDRYNRKSVQRSFIQPQYREEIVNSISVISEFIQDKEIIAIDDSIVRGTSSKKFIQQLKNAGAKKVSLLSTFPAIRFPCYMGIDFPSPEELMAHSMTSKDGFGEIGPKIAKRLGADFVGYMDPAGFSRALGLNQEVFCFSCITGDYSKLNFTPKFKSRAEMKGE